MRRATCSRSAERESETTAPERCETLGRHIPRVRIVRMNRAPEPSAHLCSDGQMYGMRERRPDGTLRNLEGNRSDNVRVCDRGVRTAPGIEGALE